MPASSVAMTPMPVRMKNLLLGPGRQGAAPQHEEAKAEPADHQRERKEVQPADNVFAASRAG